MCRSTLGVLVSEGDCSLLYCFQDSGALSHLELVIAIRRFSCELPSPLHNHPGMLQTGS